MILQQTKPEDYIISSGVSKSITDFLSIAFNHVEIYDWENYISIDNNLIRPKGNVEIVGDNSRLLSIGWSQTISFEQMVIELLKHEINKKQK